MNAYDPKKPTLVITPKKKLPTSQLNKPYTPPTFIPTGRIAANSNNSKNSSKTNALNQAKMT